MDISLHALDTLLKASRLGGLIEQPDPSRIPSSCNLPRCLVFDAGPGPLVAGAMSWFTSMVINPTEVTVPPASWADFWDRSKDAASLGVVDIQKGAFMDQVSGLPVRPGGRDMILDTGTGVVPLNPFLDTLRRDPSRPIQTVLDADNPPIGEMLVGALPFADYDGPGLSLASCQSRLCMADITPAFAAPL